MFFTWKEQLQNRLKPNWPEIITGNDFGKEKMTEKQLELAPAGRS
jgi:hypothetical protein